MSLNSSDLGSDRVFDEFSPKKLFFQFKNIVFFVISKWPIILTIALICGSAAAVYTYLKKPTYLAEITFVLDEGIASNSKSAYSKLGEEFGIELGSDAGGVFSSMSNIVELMQSRLLIEKTLKSSVTINGKSLLFADFFLDSLNYREKWMKNNLYKTIDFNTQYKDSKKNIYVNSIINNIYETLVAKNIKIDKKGKGTTIISVSCMTENELFTKYFLEALLNEVTIYYIETKTQRAKMNLEFLQKRTDSINVVYLRSMYGRASFSDSHINASKQVSTVIKDKQQTDIQILRTSYAELVKSLEAAKNSLLQETPLFQFLDTPTLPLKRFNSNVFLNFALSFSISFFMMCGYFLVFKILQNLIK